MGVVSFQKHREFPRKQALYLQFEKTSDSIEKRFISFASTDEPGKREPEVNRTPAPETGEFEGELRCDE